MKASWPFAQCSKARADTKQLQEAIGEKQERTAKKDSIEHGSLCSVQRRSSPHSHCGGPFPLIRTGHRSYWTACFGALLMLDLPLCLTPKMNHGGNRRPSYGSRQVGKARVHLDRGDTFRRTCYVFPQIGHVSFSAFIAKSVRSRKR